MVILNVKNGRLIYKEWKFFLIWAFQTDHAPFQNWMLLSLFTDSFMVLSQKNFTFFSNFKLSTIKNFCFFSKEPLITSLHSRHDVQNDIMFCRKA